ncbi:MAG: AAA family ATPase, partial [Candidatus Aenigmatarchaeota archaeon]
MKFERIKASIEINKPPSSVFNFLKKIEPRLRLNPSYRLISFEFLTPDAPKVGTRYKVKALLKDGRLLTYESMIIELEENEKLVTQEVDGRFKITLLLTPSSKGTILTHIEEFMFSEELLEKTMEENFRIFPKFLNWLFKIETFSIDEIHKRKRKLFQDLLSNLKIWLQKIKEEIEKRKFIVAIVGMRRIGKTVLMKQIGNELEGEKFFFSFDEEAYQNLESLKFVISTFLKLSKGKPYIFLDEIGRIKGWAGVLKKYHDLNKATFIISSSSYLHITKGKESLAGRLKDFVLYPWSFEEYLKFKGFEIKSVENENLEKAYTLLDSEKYSNEIIEYIKRGGFPEIFDEKDDSEIKKYIK